MGRLIPAGTGLEYYRRAKIAGEDVVDSVEQEPENIMDSLSAYDDDLGMARTGRKVDRTDREEG